LDHIGDEPQRLAHGTHAAVQGSACDRPAGSSIPLTSAGRALGGDYSPGLLSVQFIGYGIKRLEPEATISRLRIAALEPADIVFVYDQSSGLLNKVDRLANVYGQRALAAVRRPESLPIGVPLYSHVMLGMGGGLIIHADGKTVSIEVISDALQYATEEAARFQVYRRSDMTAQLAAKIVKAAVRYYSQKYSFSSYFKNIEYGKVEAKEDTTQFCSRLAVHAYHSAGLHISELPDNKVLPIDLYQICQSSPWREVTGELIETTLSTPTKEEIEKIMAEIQLPDGMPKTYSTFIEEMDEIVLVSAASRKKLIELDFDSYREVLAITSQLSKLANARFELAETLSEEPRLLSDLAAQTIIRVLQQMRNLLSVSQLPNLVDLVGETVLNSIDDNPNLAKYVGGPTPIAIQELQEETQAITIFGYLLFAQVGLCYIVANYTEAETLERYRSVRPAYAQSFLEALEAVDNLSDRERAGAEGFLWVEDETARTDCRLRYKFIIVLLKIVEHIRGAAAPS
jgi:hypothetical protein